MQYFLIKPGADDGEIFHYEMFDINPWDDCKTLYYKNAIVTAKVLLEWLPKLLAGNFSVHSQVGTPTYYGKRTEEDGLIDWQLDLMSIYNHIRAITRPYPGAFTFVKGSKMKIWEAYPFDTRIDFPEWTIGQIVWISPESELIVKCSGGLLRIVNYELENGTINMDDILSSSV